MDRLDFTEYQVQARRTQNKALNLYQTREHAKDGLVSEVGEIMGMYQKQLQGHLFEENALMLEIGDVLWFLSELCDVYGWTLEEVARANIEKLKVRYKDKFTVEQSVNRPEYRNKPQTPVQTKPSKSRHYSVKGLMKNE